MERSFIAIKSPILNDGKAENPNDMAREIRAEDFT
jgi:hypothetical protein